jgi:soluble lytic murein transglycosylase-like protein
MGLMQLMPATWASMRSRWVSAVIPINHATTSLPDRLSARDV